MKARWTTHLVWGGMALGAFGVGAVFFPAEMELGEGETGGGVKVVVAPEGGGEATRPEGVVSGDDRVRVAMEVLSDLDIEALGERLRTAGSPVEKRLAFSKLLAGLTAENALLVREQIADMDHRSGEFQEFHYAWGAVAGAEAAIFGAATPEDDMAPALAGWASADAEAALAWFEGLDMEGNEAFDGLLKERAIPVEDLRNHLMGGLVRGLAVNDPDRAAGIVREIVEGGNNAGYGVMRSVVDSVLRDGITDAANWAEELPNAGLRRVAIEQVGRRMEGEDFGAAAEWVSSIASRPEADRIVGEMAISYAQRDPVNAMGWVGELPEGKVRNESAWRAIRTWAELDSAAASEYLAVMPKSDMRDSAVGAFSVSVAWEDPKGAVAWAETLSSEEDRMKVLIAVGHIWAKSDERSAAEWLLDSGLPEEVQLKILTPEE